MTFDLLHPSTPSYFVGITRKNFLRASFPVLPYTALKRGPSTSFSESFHIRNSNNGIQLNFFWNYKAEVSVGLHDTNQTEFDKNKTIEVDGRPFTNETLEKICKTFLS